MWGGERGGEKEEKRVKSNERREETRKGRKIGIVTYTV